VLDRSSIPFSMLVAAFLSELVNDVLVAPGVRQIVHLLLDLSLKARLMDTAKSGTADSHRPDMAFACRTAATNSWR
jgi:hypothetical protein